MSESSFNESDEILAAFLNELSKAPDATAKCRIVSSYIAKYPQLENDIRELSGIEKVLEQSQQPNTIPELPREFGEFLIVRRIGHDGMGEIYEAYHDRLDRRVAIKIIRRGWASDESR